MILWRLPQTRSVEPPADGYIPEQLRVRTLPRLSKRPKPGPAESIAEEVPSTDPPLTPTPDTVPRSSQAPVMAQGEAMASQENKRHVGRPSNQDRLRESAAKNASSILRFIQPPNSDPNPFLSDSDVTDDADAEKMLKVRCSLHMQLECVHALDRLQMIVIACVFGYGCSFLTTCVVTSCCSFFHAL